MAEYKKFKCVFCGQRMEYDPVNAGRHIKCPACGHKIAIPGEKPPGINLQSGDQTWATNVDAPDLETPTRYRAPKDEDSPPSRG